MYGSEKVNEDDNGEFRVEGVKAGESPRFNDQ